MSEHEAESALDSLAEMRGVERHPTETSWWVWEQAGTRRKWTMTGDEHIPLKSHVVRVQYTPATGEFGHVDTLCGVRAPSIDVLAYYRDRDDGDDFYPLAEAPDDLRRCAMCRWNVGDDNDEADE